MDTFSTAFEPRARHVRTRLALRGGLTGAAWGSLVAAAGAAATWYLGIELARAASATVVFSGALVGWLVTHRRRWSDGEVALFLDARLGSRELLATALGATASGDVRQQATEVLSRAPRGVGPGIWTRALLAAPVGVGLIAGAAMLPPRAGETPATPPGTERVQRAGVAGLEAIERLRDVEATDPEQLRKLQSTADRARRLRASLRAGVERRRALSDLATIRDDIRSSFVDTGSEQAESAREASATALGQVAALRAAADALRAGDLVEMDARMHAQANAAEAEARDAALEALEHARDAAARAGAADLGATLERQRQLLEQRMRDAARLRELAAALGERLGEAGQRAVEELDRSGSLAAQAALAEALDAALSTLSAEDRARLAERLAHMASSADDGAPRWLTDEELRHMARQVATAEGRQRMAATLRRLARPEPGADARRERALRDAERGANDAARELAATPLPGAERGRDDTGAPGGEPGAMPGGSSGDTKTPGSAAPLDGAALRSKAQAHLDLAAPTRLAGPGRSAAETSPATGAPPALEPFQAARTEQLRGIDRGDLPETYREQVHRYFAP